VKTYMPASVVLPEYTDEALLAERGFAGEVAKTLLRVPAEYRQSVEAEGFRRSVRVTQGSGGHSQMESIADRQETRLQVVDEVLAQLAEETP
jgi:hypothetical protein